MECVCLYACVRACVRAWHCVRACVRVYQRMQSGACHPVLLPMSARDLTARQPGFAPEGRVGAILVQYDWSLGPYEALVLSSFYY